MRFSFRGKSFVACLFRNSMKLFTMSQPNEKRINLFFLKYIIYLKKVYNLMHKRTGNVWMKYKKTVYFCCKVNYHGNLEKKLSKLEFPTFVELSTVSLSWISCVYSTGRTSESKNVTLWPLSVSSRAILFITIIWLRPPRYP